MRQQNNQEMEDFRKANNQPPKQVGDSMNAENRNNSDEEEKNSSSKRHVRTTVVLIIIIIILILLLLRQCSAGVPVLNPDYPPQKTEQNATPISGGGGSKLEHEEGGGAVILDFNDALVIDLSDKQAKLNFANPAQSTQDMMLQIVIQDVVVAQSGRIPAGYEVRKLELEPNADKMLSEGTYNGTFFINYYDPETNERAMLNSEAAVTIEVYP